MTRYCYAALAHRSNQVANFLASQCVAPGERVLMRVGNVIALWKTMLATTQLGAVMIPATRLSQRADLEDRLARGGVSADMDTAFAAVALFPRGNRSQAKTGRAFSYQLPSGASVYGLLDWIALRCGDVHPNLSSPRGAKHAWSCFFAPWNAETAVLVYRFARFSASAFLDQLVRRRVTTFCAPPAVWRVLVPQDLRRWPVVLREAGGAAEPANLAVIDQVRAACNLTIRDGFGRIETTAQIANPPSHLLKLGSPARLQRTGLKDALVDMARSRARSGEPYCILGV